MQREMVEREPEVPEERRIRFLHLPIMPSERSADEDLRAK
jgi:hypothetical protein